MVRYVDPCPFEGFRTADLTINLQLDFFFFFLLPCVENRIQVCCDFLTRKACSWVSCGFWGSGIPYLMVLGEGRNVDHYHECHMRDHVVEGWFCFWIVIKFWLLLPPGQPRMTRSRKRCPAISEIFRGLKFLIQSRVCCHKNI